MADGSSSPKYFKNKLNSASKVEEMSNSSRMRSSHYSNNTPRNRTRSPWKEGQSNSPYSNRDQRGVVANSSKLDTDYEYYQSSGRKLIGGKNNENSPD